MKTIAFKLILISFISSLLMNCSDNQSITGDSISSEEINELISELPQVDNPQMLNPSVLECTEIPHSRNELTNLKQVVKIYNGKTDAGITLANFGGVKLGKNEINLNVYYIESKVVCNGGDSLVYGLGYSVHYLFKKIKRGLSVSNLPKIAASVQIDNQKTEVYYSIQSFGMASSTELTKYFKPNVDKDFDVEGFAIMQSHIDGIHNVLADSALSSHVRFTPQLFRNLKPQDLREI